MHRLLICGGNGAGKSTVGRMLADMLGWRFLDVEDYFFERKGDYSSARPRETACALIAMDMAAGDCVLAAVRGDIDARVDALITEAAYLRADRQERIRRVRERSYAMFGERVQMGGDMYESERAFWDMVERRPDDYAYAYLRERGIDHICVDAMRLPEQSAREIADWISGRQDLP